MSALIRQIALVSESWIIQGSDVSRVAAALQKQASQRLYGGCINIMSRSYEK